jgi:hypothetical protein
MLMSFVHPAVVLVQAVLCLEVESVGHAMGHGPF